MSKEEVLANSDLQVVKILIRDNPNDSAIVMNLGVFNRLMTHYPKLFTLKGKAIIFDNEWHVYFHNSVDGDIRTRKANKSLEEEQL